MDSETQPSVVVHGICERDIDLLLLEELVASADFRVWFLGELGIRPDATLKQAERSVSAVSGESDLALTFRAGGETVRVLVENKVDAPLQRGRTVGGFDRLSSAAAAAVVAAISASTGRWPARTRQKSSSALRPCASATASVPKITLSQGVSIACLNIAVATGIALASASNDCGVKPERE